MENWKDIKAYEGIYQVSELGNIRRWRKKNKEWFYLKPLKHSGGYHRVKLRNKGNDKDTPSNVPHIFRLYPWFLILDF